MQSQPVISYRNLEPVPAIDAVVAKRIAVLERINDRLIGCDVTMEAPQKRKLHGRVFKVRLHVRLPGPDLDVSREVAQGSAQDDLILAVNRAFSALEKQLKRRKQEMAAVEVKHHPPLLHGEITLLEPELGYGQVRADDGHEVYFQRDALTSDDWERLAKGTHLRFREMAGEKGPYATGVTVID